MRSVEATGKTIDDAVKNGLEQLGIERDDALVEVLESPKSGFLGFGSSPAKVKVTDVREAPLALDEVEAIPVPEEQETPEDGPAASETPEVPEPQAAPKKSSTPQEREEKARQFVQGLLERLGTPAQVEVMTDGEDNLRVNLSGEDMGLVIGRRGETLDAIQHLATFAVNRGEGKRVRVLMDTENYRARREESLQRLARKTASKVVKFRRSLTLEPMNAYERHVIHEALQDWRDVSTASTGVDPNRRVVISYTPNRER